MLRFCGTDFIESESIRINAKTLTFGSGMWKECQDIIRECECWHASAVDVVPVRDKEGRIAAYGYQDNEANRELRMLRELGQCSGAIRFNDLFPDCHEVVICGCNELAVNFAEYLAGVEGIRVSVSGKYWEHFGYDGSHIPDLGGKGKMVIFAEGVMSNEANLEQMVKKSVSVEFECIDRLYEANVLEGKIRDTIGDFEDLVRRLDGEREIVIMGDGRESLDAYDLLLGYGIDICGFVVEVKTRNRLFGKRVMGMDESITRLQAPIFLDCRNQNGALGEECTEYFDYRGFMRNRQMFLLRDYTEIPVSNLTHVLRGKNVVLAGDRRLCTLLSEYLYQIEDGAISIRCMEMGRMEPIGADDIVCGVFPDYYNRVFDVQERRKSEYGQFLSEIGLDNYTDYFMRSRSFAIIDEYLNQRTKKYTNPELIPKGMLLGRILGWSGNVFFKGIMDGHPEVLVMPYSELNDNLFWYCIRLAGCNSNRILDEFWEMYDEEAGSRETDFGNREGFEAGFKRFLGRKDSFTSQELFVMFHIAYVEMLSGVCLSDVRGFVIYWEPHFVPRYDFPYLARWLEDGRINGQTIVLRRNNVVRTGSACARVKDGQESVMMPFYTMFIDGSVWNAKDLVVMPEFRMRFEDIKLNPKEELEKVCRRMDIEWSDKMLETTSGGQPVSYRGSTGFDLKPVFNKYDDFLSEFDRLRISIACSPYQKKYGYPYENCLKFSRREIQEMFLKPFLFESNELFKTDNKTQGRVREWMKWRLWDVRKHMVLDDIQPEFGQIEIK